MNPVDPESMFSPHDDGRGTSKDSFSIGTATAARARRRQRYLRKFRKRIERDVARCGATSRAGAGTGGRGATKLARCTRPRSSGSTCAARIASGPQGWWCSKHSVGRSGPRGEALRTTVASPRAACANAPDEADSIGDPAAGEEIAAPASTKVNTRAASKPPAPIPKTANGRNLSRDRIPVV